MFIMLLVIMKLYARSNTFKIIFKVLSYKGNKRLSKIAMQ